jgi:hypothetical protein
MLMMAPFDDHSGHKYWLLVVRLALLLLHDQD